MSSWVAPDMFTTGPAGWAFPGLEPQAYGYIMCDPPWHFVLRSEAGAKKSAQAQYETMTIADIAALPVGDLARETCILWLWATAPMLPQQIAIGEAWGFRYATSGAWVKRTRSGKLAFGTGYILRSAHEPFLIFSRGDPLTTKSIRSVIEAETREHSRKPDEAYDAAERMMPQAFRRADLFSRQSRPGWEPWGLEAGKFDNMEVA